MKLGWLPRAAIVLIAPVLSMVAAAQSGAPTGQLDIPDRHPFRRQAGSGDPQGDGDRQRRGHHRQRRRSAARSGHRLQQPAAGAGGARAGPRAGAAKPDRRDAGDPGRRPGGHHRRSIATSMPIMQRIANNFHRTPEAFSAYLRSVGSSDQSLKRQITRRARLGAAPAPPDRAVRQCRRRRGPGGHRPPQRLARHGRISRRGNLHVGHAGDARPGPGQCREHRPADPRRRQFPGLCPPILRSIDRRGGRRSRLGARRAASRRARRDRPANAGRRDQRADPGSRRRLDHRAGRQAPDPGCRSARRRAQPDADRRSPCRRARPAPRPRHAGSSSPRRPRRWAAAATPRRPPRRSAPRSSSTIRCGCAICRRRCSRCCSASASARRPQPFGSPERLSVLVLCGRDDPPPAAAPNPRPDRGADRAGAGQPPRAALSARPSPRRGGRLSLSGLYQPARRRAGRSGGDRA